MNLLSNIDLGYNSGIKSSAVGIIEGNILNVTEFPDGSKTVQYNYKVEGVVIKQATFPVAKEDVQAMYDAIKTSLPSASNIILRDWTIYYRAFQIEMAITFETEIANIDIIA